MGTPQRIRNLHFVGKFETRFISSHLEADVEQSLDDSHCRNALPSGKHAWKHHILYVQSYGAGRATFSNGDVWC